MQQRNKIMRRLALALAVPILAVGFMLVGAPAGASSPGQAPQAAPTDQPAEPDGNAPATEFTDNPQPSEDNSGSTDTSTTDSRTPSGSDSYSPSYTSTPTPSPSSATPSGSPSSGSSSGGGGPGGAGGAGGCATSSPPVTVKVGQAGGHDALVDQSGCALYVFTKDTPVSSACDSGCEGTWPPLAGPAKAGSGVQQANLGTFTRQGGKTQATYFGKQLYRNKGDSQPGQTTGQGKDGAWYLVDKNGNPITG